jgi:hypothetical protein
MSFEYQELNGVYLSVSEKTSISHKDSEMSDPPDEIILGRGWRVGLILTRAASGGG